MSFNFNLHNLNEMFDKTININNNFNIFLNDSNNTHYLQINYIEKNDTSLDRDAFNNIKNSIINNSKLICRNSIDKEYIISSIDKSIGIIYVIKYPIQTIYGIQQNQPEIIAFAILSLVDFYDNTGFPFDPSSNLETNYFPKKVGEIFVLCAIDDPIKVSIELESGDREDDFLTFGIGTYIQYQACRIFRDVYNLDYSLGHSASLSLLIHYMKIGYLFGIPYIKNFGEINMDDVVDHLYLNFTLDYKNELLNSPLIDRNKKQFYKELFNDNQSQNESKTEFLNRKKKSQKLFDKKFKDVANAKNGSFEEQIRSKLATNLLDNVYDKLTDIFTSDLNKLSILIDEPDLNIVKYRLEDEPEFFEHLFYEISTKFVEPHKDVYLRFMPLRNTFYIQRNTIDAPSGSKTSFSNRKKSEIINDTSSDTPLAPSRFVKDKSGSDRLNILKNYSFNKIKNYLTVLSSL